MKRWHRTIARKNIVVPEHAIIEDIWDVIHYCCPLSKLEAKVLIHRYLLGKGERELAQELGVPWRSLNRATWRMKGKLRSQLVRLADIRRLE